MQIESTQRLCSNIITEFVEVAIHSIIYYSSLYPENVFSRKKKYSISVQICIHPKIKEYVKQCMHAAWHLLKLKQLFKIVLCFFDNDLLVCQFCFLLTDYDNILKRDPYLLRAEFGFREFCLRLSMIQNFFKSPLSDNATFKILLVTTERASVEMVHNEGFQDCTFIQTTDDKSTSELAIVPLSEEFPIGLHVYAEKPLH